jgi:hypothetical protein
VTVCTNGLHLPVEKYASLLDHGLGQLQISLHNLSEDGFVHRRPKKSVEYASYFNGICELIEENLSRDTASEIMLFIMISKRSWLSSEIWDMQGIIEETENFIALFQPVHDDISELLYKHAGGLECDIEVIFEEYRKLAEGGASSIVRLGKRLSMQLVSLDTYRHNHHAMEKMVGESIGKVELIPARSVGCVTIATPFISYDGRLSACCKANRNDISSDKFLIGDFSDGFSSIDITGNEKYKQLLGRLKSHHDPLTYCSNCAGRYHEKGEL